MASPTIFQQYLRPVRSVQDYSADMDRRDMARLQLEGQQGQNALQQVTRQQTIAAAQQAAARQNKLAALAQQYQDPAAFEDAALRDVDLYDVGKERRADRLSAEKTAAESAKAREESDALKLQRSIQELGVHATARDAIASLDADQTIPPGFKAALRSRFEAAGDDPNAYKATLYDLILSRAKPAEQAAAMAPPKPEKPAAPTSAVQEYQFAVGQGYKGSFEQWKQSQKPAAASIVNYGSPVPVQLPDGSVGYVQPSNRGGPVAPMADVGGKPMVKPTEAKDKDLTEAAAKATTYLGQMRSASKTLKDIGADQTALSVQAETALAGGAMNIAVREKAQRVRQSQDQWSEAFLRFKTGAASTPAEVAANRKTFFPTVGDKDETVKQKLEMRRQAERDMEIAAGRGVKQLDSRGGGPAAPAAGEWKIERVQ